MLPLSLTSCALFGGNQENGRSKITIQSASFTATYSTISFNFRKDENAIYYNAYFKGDENKTLSRIEPKTTYTIPDLSDGKYNVFLKAFANVNYEDSDLFLMGELNKIKTAKEVENLSLFAELTEERKLSITVEDKSGESTPITVFVKKDGKTEETRKNIKEKTTFLTNRLSSGTYTVSAFFQETNEHLASDEVFYDEQFALTSQIVEISDLTSVYSKGKVKLNWTQNVVDASLRTKLTISSPTKTETFTNRYKNKSIVPGLEIDAADFGEGETTFRLQILADENTDFVSSEELVSSTTISKYKLDALNFTVEMNYKGEVVIDCEEPMGALPHLKIYSIGVDPYDFSSNEEFELEGTVSSFPYVLKDANTTWKRGNYAFELTNLSKTSLEIDSDTIRIDKEIGEVVLKPNVTVVRKDNPSSNGGGYKFIFTSHTPEWLSELEWTHGNYYYYVDFNGYGDGIASYYFEGEGTTQELILPEEKMVYGYQNVYVGVNRDYGEMPSEGYRFENIEVFEGYYGVESAYPLLEDLRIERESMPYGFRPPYLDYTVSVIKKYAYLDLAVGFTYSVFGEEESGLLDFEYWDEETGEKLNARSQEVLLKTGRVEYYFSLPTDAQLTSLYVDAYIGDDCDSIEWEGAFPWEG